MCTRERRLAVCSGSHCRGFGNEWRRSAESTGVSAAARVGDRLVVRDHHEHLDVQGL
jgi:hypothetical protein